MNDMKPTTPVQGHPAAMSYNEMIDFFVDHVFFEFMERGRTGLWSGIDTTVRSFTIWVVDKSEDTAEPLLALPAAAEDRVKREAVKLVTDGFIRSGTHGLRAAVQSIHTRLYHAMSEEARVTRPAKTGASRPAAMTPKTRAAGTARPARPSKPALSTA